MRQTLPTRRLGTAALALALLIGPTAAPGLASGPTVHLQIAGTAVSQVTDPGLRSLLVDQFAYQYGAGSLFPDSALNSLLALGHDSHGTAFLNTYIDLIEKRCGTNPNLNDLECRQLIAHFMGCLAHILGDQHFDQYFLMRVDALCDYNDGGSGACVTGFPYTCSQGFTDRTLDMAWAYNIGAALPLNTLPGPYDFWCPWPWWCYCNDQPVATCLNIERVLDAAFQDDFGHTQIQAWVNSHFALVNSLFVTSGADFQIAANTCDGWPLLNLNGNVGGILDSGRVVAETINKTWELLKSGGKPRFRQNPAWLFPSTTMSVYRSAPAPDDAPEEYDFGSWLSLGNWAGDVDSFQLADVTYADHPEWPTLPVIGTLADGVLRMHYGEYFDSNVAQLTLATDVARFAVSGSRLAILVGPASVTGGRELRVKHVGSSLETDPWVTLASDVVDFRLEGDRVAALQRIRERGQTVDRLLALDGDLGAGLSVIARGRLAGFELEGDRVAVIDDDGPYWAPQQQWSAATPQTAQATQTLRVMEGPSLDGPWVELVQVEGPISDLALEGERIAYVTAGQLWLKQGGLAAPWIHQASDVVQVLLEQDWIGALIDVPGLGVCLLSKKSPDDLFELEYDQHPVRQAVLASASAKQNDNLWVVLDDTFGNLHLGDLGLTSSMASEGGVEALPVVGQIDDFQVHQGAALPWTVTAYPYFGRPLRLGALVDGTLYVKSNAFAK